MRVYRIESKASYGGIIEDIWWGAFSSKHITYTKDAIYAHEGCSIGDYNSDYRLGCRTLEKLVEYFGSDFARLISQETIRVVEYEVERKHVVFSKKRIELTFRIDKVKGMKVIL